MIRENGIKLVDVLKLESFENSSIICGEAALHNYVTTVNVMVDPDILSFLSEGEFLLMTAYHFQTTNLDEQMALIRAFSNKKLSAVGIKVKPYIDRLPDEVVELAETLNLPIVEIDYEDSFTEIMTAIFHELFAKQSSVIQKVESIQKSSMDVVLKGGSIEDILRTVSDNIGNPALIKDQHFEKFLCHSDMCDMSDEDLIQDFNEMINSEKLNIGEGQVTSEFTTINDQRLERLIVPIFVKNSIYGYIVLYGACKELTSYDQLYLESVSSIIALEFLKQLSVNEVENKYKAEFFEDLISFDERRKEKAIERSNYYRFDKDANYSIVSIRLEKEEGITNQIYNQKIAKVMYLVDMVCKSDGRIFLMANKGMNINILLMWRPEEQQRKQLMNLIKRMKEVLDSKMGAITYRIGIGRLYDGIGNAYKSLNDAEKAVEASETYINEQIIDFNTLGIYKIFCQDNLKDELISFYESTLKPLVDYDRKRDTELVKSLIVYFETNGNLKKMSELLFTHYNTVLYRINRIQEITGKSLDTEMDRYGLQTALKIMKILDL